MEAQLKSPPLELTKRHWRSLLEYWTRDNVMMTERNKANRAKKKLSQLTGKKSFARIREELKVSLGREPTRVDMFKECYSNGIGESEAACAFEKMKKLTEKLGDGATDAPGPDDVFATIMGTAKNGTAKMYGLGVRANHLWGAGPSRLALNKENAHLMSKNAKLEDENARLKALVEKNNGPGVQTDGSRVHDNGSGVRRLRVGKEVYIKSINFENVARGWLKSMEPSTVVLGTETGHYWCEVENVTDDLISSWYVVINQDGWWQLEDFLYLLMLAGLLMNVCVFEIIC
ncbi:uncharacterized protein [Rutidosis leptorrhynchoides]|uniref:uncharacterized protein n=1 Tax=Rutidosis leptorrhynchoides TaxID=125765 RepID=UPI003A9984AD